LICVMTFFAMSTSLLQFRIGFVARFVRFKASTALTGFRARLGPHLLEYPT